MANKDLEAIDRFYSLELEIPLGLRRRLCAGRGPLCAQALPIQVGWDLRPEPPARPKAPIGVSSHASSFEEVSTPMRLSKTAKPHAPMFGRGKQTFSLATCCSRNSAASDSQPQSTLDGCDDVAPNHSSHTSAVWHYTTSHLQKHAWFLETQRRARTCCCISSTNVFEFQPKGNIHRTLQTFLSWSLVKFIFYFSGCFILVLFFFSFSCFFFVFSSILLLLLLLLLVLVLVVLVLFFFFFFLLFLLFLFMSSLLLTFLLPCFWGHWNGCWMFETGVLFVVTWREWFLLVFTRW